MNIAFPFLIVSVALTLISLTLTIRGASRRTVAGIISLAAIASLIAAIAYLLR